MAHEGAPDGHHLLLATRHQPHALPPASGQAWEEIVRPRETRLRVATNGRAELQVLLDRHVGKEIAALRDLHHSTAKRSVRRVTGDVLPIQADATRHRPD